MDLNAIKLAAAEAAKEAGRFLLQEARLFDKSKIELKEFNNLVSYVDKEAEKMLVDRLRGILPEAGMIAEEGTGEPSESGLNWIIDPLDGTTNFSHGLPVFSVSLSLHSAIDGMLVGVVYEPNRDECFHAAKGGGAYLNDKKIQVSQAPDLKSSLLATGFPYCDFGLMDNYLATLKVFMEKSRGLRRLGSAAVDLCYVACGRFEAYYEYGLSPWDVAGGALIVQEAGGIVTDFDGADAFIFGRQIIAANAKVHSEVRAVVKKCFG